MCLSIDWKDSVEFIKGKNKKDKITIYMVEQSTHIEKKLLLL